MVTRTGGYTTDATAAALGAAGLAAAALVASRLVVYKRFAPLFGSRWRPLRLPNSLDLAALVALGAAGRDMFHILVGRARSAAWQQGRV